MATTPIDAGSGDKIVELGAGDNHITLGDGANQIDIGNYIDAGGDRPPPLSAMAT